MPGVSELCPEGVVTAGRCFVVGWQKDPGEEHHLSGTWASGGFSHVFKGMQASHSPQPRCLLADITFQVTEQFMLPLV